MGEAKRRRNAVQATVFHHTSALRTNLIWMSGVIEVEGAGKPAIHPLLGEIRMDALLRRKMIDFPPVAWFTTRLDIPKCLLNSSFSVFDQDTGEVKEIEVDRQVGNLIELQRFALGFPISDIGVIPWVNYYGYSTPEGVELNRSARALGDNPDDWYVSETPIDMLSISTIYASRSKLHPKLERTGDRIDDVRRIVRSCRDDTSLYVAPTWISTEQAAGLAQQLGIELRKA